MVVDVRFPIPYLGELFVPKSIPLLGVRQMRSLVFILSRLGSVIPGYYT